MNEQKIVLEVNNVDMNFLVTREIFDKYSDEMGMNDKVAPSNQFLARSVEKDSKKDLMEFLKTTPGGEIELAGVLATEFKPDTSIVVKPRSNAAKK